MATPKRLQSVELDVPAKAGEGKPRRHPDWPNAEPFKTEDPSIQTLYDNFAHGVKISGTGARPLVGLFAAGAQASAPRALTPPRALAVSAYGRFAANLPCFGVRAKVNGQAGPYVWQTYAEVDVRVRNIGYDNGAPARARAPRSPP